MGVSSYTNDNNEFNCLLRADSESKTLRDCERLRDPLACTYTYICIHTEDIFYIYISSITVEWIPP